MQTPEQLSASLVETLGTNLRAVAVYGSAASGDRTKKFSDVNLLIVVGNTDGPTLASMAPIFSGWIKGGNKPPIVMSESQLKRSSDVFPLELSDIRERHRTIHGDETLFASIAIRPEHLRHQLEFELRSKLLLLRQGYIETGGKASAVEELMARSLSSVAALFRGIIRLAGDRVPASTPQVLRAVDARVPVDAEAWEAVWRLRQGERLPSHLTAEALMSRLLRSLENAADFVDAFHA